MHKNAPTLTVYPLDKQSQAEAFGRRLTELRREAAKAWDPSEFLFLHRKTLENTSRLLALLASLSEAETIAFGATLARQNFGGPVL